MKKLEIAGAASARQIGKKPDGKQPQQPAPQVPVGGFGQTGGEKK